MKFDVAIVGSGLAGLSVALHLAQTRTVAIISKRALLDGASNWAQGGIAAVLDSGDSYEEHINDTLVAGAGLCDEAATRYIVEHGREAIEWLIEQGVPFTRDSTAEMGFHLTREGGHSQRRIIHAADATGHAVQLTLEQKVRAHPNITLFEQHCAIDVISSDKLTRGAHPGQPLPPRCVGLYVQDEKTGAVLTFEAEHTVLCTGGAGKTYLYTTNPDTATG
ncbi:MAG: FAD-dependent oxidoreductase, partial [Pseudomonadota bacterium]|nr:FAD-dependent oxidoreductase [Pseudomonadota bacterium]